MSMKARLAEYPITITLTRQECRWMETAAVDLEALLAHTVQTLDLLSDAIMLGAARGNAEGVACVMNLVSRALRLADEKELPVLMMLDERIRHEVGKAKGV